jgi:hexosaminidase
MVLLTTMFKTLFMLFLFGFLFIIYRLLQINTPSYPTIEDNYSFEAKDDYSRYEYTPLSINIGVIPMPELIKTQQSALLLLNHFQIVSNSQNPSKILQLALLRYSKYISSLTGISTKIDQSKSPSQNKLLIDCSLINLKNSNYPELGEDESYKLNVNRTGSYIDASSLTGIIRGLSTFVQLVEKDLSSEKYYIPFVNIIDRPRFRWRGLMLDVARHWMPVSVIERTLNAMELSKLNILHLHLSDDQGFRVESIEHRLLHDRKDFFTQKDIQHLVTYAEQRRIRIVPEFDIPAHTTR